MFTLTQKSDKSQARLGIFQTAHGQIETPFFLPIATRGVVKGLTVQEINTLGAQIILSNTYHLWLKPGLELINKAGGLHNFMGWVGSILTDSGGFQIFSLSKIRKVSDTGVEFQSPEDGAKHFLSPRLALEIQAALGSDIAMVLDECVASNTGRELALDAVQRTTRWARQQAEEWPKIKKDGQQLFGIVQGSVYQDLRLMSAEQISTLPFDGIALGGLAVGEEPEEMYQILDYTVPVLPQEQLHYLMGVGYPENIVQAVKRGIDCFDCVIPTREARHGRLYIWPEIRFKAEDEFLQSLSSADFYQTINIERAPWRTDLTVLNPGCQCLACAELKISRAYLHHLFDVREALAERLATIHNLHFYLDLMRLIRQAIKKKVL